MRIDVPEHDTTFTLEPVERRAVGDVPSFAVRDGHPENLARLVPMREQRVGALHAQTYRLRHELQSAVAHQRTWQEVRLTENLKPVANADHRSSTSRVRCDLVHDGTEACDRTGT